MLSQIPRSEDPLHVVERLLPEKTVQLVAAYYQQLIELGKSQGEIEAAFTNPQYVLSSEVVLPLLAEIGATPAPKRKYPAPGAFESDEETSQHQSVQRVPETANSAQHRQDPGRY